MFISMSPYKKHWCRTAAFLCTAALLAAAAGAARANDRVAERDNALIRMLTERFRLNADNARHITCAVEQAADKLKLPRSLILAVIATESSFNTRATSPVGAAGLMQVMPSTQRDIAPQHSSRADLYEPMMNVYVGATILRHYLDQAGGDTAQALRRYSGGTRGYVQRVLASWRFFSDFADPDAPSDTLLAALSTH